MSGATLDAGSGRASRASSGPLPLSPHGWQKPPSPFACDRQSGRVAPPRPVGRGRKHANARASCRGRSARKRKAERAAASHAAPAGPTPAVTTGIVALRSRRSAHSHERRMRKRSPGGVSSHDARRAQPTRAELRVDLDPELLSRRRGRAPPVGARRLPLQVSSATYGQCSAGTIADARTDGWRIEVVLVLASAGPTKALNGDGREVGSSLVGGNRRGQAEASSTLPAFD
jgi:hypothetical protein